MLTYDQVREMCAGIGFPYAYDHFAEGEAPALPYLVYRFPKTRPFAADDTVYSSTEVLNLELYQRYKNPEEEARVKAALVDHGCIYRRSEVWLGSEGMYMVLFETEVLLDGQEQG